MPRITLAIACALSARVLAAGGPPQYGPSAVIPSCYRSGHGGWRVVAPFGVSKASVANCRPPAPWDAVNVPAGGWSAIRCNAGGSFDCKGGEDFIEIDSRGAQGPPGPQGPKGDSGASCSIPVVESDPQSPQPGDAWFLHRPGGYSCGDMITRVGDAHDQPYSINIASLTDLACSLFANQHDPGQSATLFTISPDGGYSGPDGLGPNQFKFYPIGAVNDYTIFAYGEGTTYQQLADHLNGLTTINATQWVFIDDGWANAALPSLAAFNQNRGIASVRAYTPAGVMPEAMILKVQGAARAFSTTLQ